MKKQLTAAGIMAIIVIIFAAGSVFLPAIAEGKEYDNFVVLALLWLMYQSIWQQIK